MTPAADRFGNPASAASYDGDAGTYLEVAPHPLLPVGAAPRTVSVWIETSHAYSNFGGLWNWGSSAQPYGQRFGLLITAAGNDAFIGEFQDVVGTKILNNGAWHHTVVTFDGQQITTYVDSFYSASGDRTLNTGTPYLEIGRSSFDHGAVEPYFGTLDDLRIYNRVLSAAERGQLYLEGGWHGSPADPGPQGSPGSVSRIRLTPEPSGGHCTNGGVRIDTGVDANSNGRLDDSEIDSTGYACNGLICSVGSETACSGTCVDLATDPVNCGSCGRSCGGGTCLASLCQPITLASYPVANGPTSMVVDGSNVYWVNQNDGSVAKVPIAGGTATTLAAGSGNAWQIAIDATNVYWSDSGSLKVSKVPLGGGSTTVLASGEINPVGIAVDGSNVYWTNYFGGTVRKAPIGGGSPTTLVSGQSNPTGMVVDATSVYWVNSPQNGVGSALMKAPLGGGSATLLSPAECGPSNGGIVLDGTSVYWVNNSGGTVKKLPLAGGTVTTLATGQDGPYRIALDATNVYWTNQTGGTVMKAPIAGGAATTIASGQNTPQGVAVDATSIYWTNWGNSTVMKLAK